MYVAARNVSGLPILLCHIPPCGLNGKAVVFASFGHVGCSYITSFARAAAAMEPDICEIFLGTVC
jgi:hypothetical protein